MADGQVFLSQEVESKPNSQNKNCWGQKEVKRSEVNGHRALALCMTAAEVKGW